MAYASRDVCPAAACSVYKVDLDRVTDLDELDGTEDGAYELDARLDLANHSPGGFAWGYGGSGPAQLSLAILADCAGDKLALEHYQTFKDRCVSQQDQDEPFYISDEVLDGHMAAIEVTGGSLLKAPATGNTFTVAKIEGDTMRFTGMSTEIAIHEVGTDIRAGVLRVMDR